jgi:multimeric flavodoxin WrbA
MKVLAINSSARPQGQSKTKLMLDHLVEGMREAGAEVEVVNLREKDIKYCIGCLTCWTKTPGVCLHKDDMTSELYPKFLASDLAILATPLYHFTINAQMKTFIERTLPAIHPYFKESGGKIYHPLRGRHPMIVMLSVAGFPQHSVFDQLSSWVNFIYGAGGGLAAEIYRPFAESLMLPFFKDKADDILDATRQAGFELVKTLRVSPDTMERIRQDITQDSNALLKTVGNIMWKTCIEEGITPKEFTDRGVIPRPDSIESFMALMSIAFNPRAAGNTRAVMQYDFSGEVEGSCHFTIADGRISSQGGPAGKADITISTPFEVWMDILTKKADGQQMFMEQKYSAKGDLNLLMRMKDLFGGQDV